MLTPVDETELRTRTSDLVLSWHLEQRGPLDAAEAGDYRALVEAAAVVADEGGTCLRNWVGAARRAGLSWEEIGAALGVTRQAAQKRFATGDHPDGADGAGADQGPGLLGRVTRTGVTAFNEVGILREEGAAGRRLVGAEMFKLHFEQTDRPWNNLRVTSLRRERTVAAMTAEGWTFALSWFPFHYFTRPAAPEG